MPHPLTENNTATFASPSGSSWTMDSVSEAGSAVGAHSAGRTRCPGKSRRPRCTGDDLGATRGQLGACCRRCPGLSGALRRSSRSVCVCHGDGFKLGEWLGARRVDRNRGWLSPKRVRELDALGMVWDAREENWQRGIAAARAYHEETASSRPFQVRHQGRLPTWVVDHRPAHTHNGTLSPERIAALDAVGHDLGHLSGRLAARG